MSGSRSFCGNCFCGKLRLVRPFVIVLLALVVVTGSSSLAGQSTTSTDLQFHKFQPAGSPERAASSQATKELFSNGARLSVAEQMQALQQEKASRTPAQQRIDSNILYTVRMLAGQSAAPGVPYLDTGVDLDAHDNIVVDMVANVSDQLLHQLKAAGAQVLYSNRALRSVRAVIPPQQIEGIAASADVIFI